MAKSRLRLALERMALYTAGPFRAEYATATRHAMWTVRGMFYLPHGTTYDDISQILEEWSADDTLERLVGPRRTARIQVAYDQGRGRSGEYTLAEIGAWDFCLGRAAERVDVRDGDRDALSERYGNEGNTSAVTRLIVWLGSDLREVTGLEF